MTRAALGLILAACLTPATGFAWTFTATPVCTLSDETDEAAVRITYDPRQPEPYAIDLTLDGATWPEGPSFALRFDGPRAGTIATNRHVHPDGARSTLRVTDRGFGNLLDGLEFNTTATALIAEAAVAFPLEGAAEPVRRFRACTVTPAA